MNEETSRTSSGSDDMRAVVTSYTQASGVPGGIPEEHQPFAKAVLAMDPIRDVRGSLSDDNTVRPNYQLKVEGLPPELQREARERLQGMGSMDEEAQAKAETRVVSELVTSKLGATRSVTGVHKESLPFHKQMAEIAGQVQQLHRKRQDYVEWMDEIVDVKGATDPETGEVIAEPVYRLSELKRKNYANTVEDIDRQIRLLIKEDGSFGVQGKRQMDEALAESAALLHKQDQQRREEQAAKELAAKTLSEERVARRAKVLADMHRSTNQ